MTLVTKPAGEVRQMRLLPGLQEEAHSQLLKGPHIEEPPSSLPGQPPSCLIQKICVCSLEEMETGLDVFVYPSSWLCHLDLLSVDPFSVFRILITELSPGSSSTTPFFLLFLLPMNRPTPSPLPLSQVQLGTWDTRRWALARLGLQGYSSILSGLPPLSPTEPPAQVTLKLQPSQVYVGDAFTIECTAEAVKPLESLTLSLLHNGEILQNQTFGGAESNATAIFNRTALTKDCLSLSCQAELDLRPHGGHIIHNTSEPQILQVMGKEMLGPEGQRWHPSWHRGERKPTSPTPR